MYVLDMSALLGKPLYLCRDSSFVPMICILLHYDYFRRILWFRHPHFSAAPSSCCCIMGRMQRKAQAITSISQIMSTLLYHTCMYVCMHHNQALCIRMYVLNCTPVKFLLRSQTCFLSIFASNIILPLFFPTSAVIKHFRGGGGGVVYVSGGLGGKMK